MNTEVIRWLVKEAKAAVTGRSSTVPVTDRAEMLKRLSEQTPAAHQPPTRYGRTLYVRAKPPEE